VKWENGKKEDKERQGEVTRARLERVCPAKLMEEGGRCQLFCKLKELLIHEQR